MITQMINILDYTLDFIRQQVSDLSDEEMVMQPTGAPNHAVWTLGHVIHSCQAIASELGKDTRSSTEWESCFGYGTRPNPVNTENLSKSSLLAHLAETSNQLRTALQALDSRFLDKPPSEEKMRKVFPTMGHVLMQIVIAHTAYHAGQLAAWRRGIGRTPVGVFI
jgi:uncharacterized damage-inducible protein DinB